MLHIQKVAIPAAHTAAAHLLPGTLLVVGGVLLFKLWASHSWYYNWKGHRKTSRQREELEQQLRDLQEQFDALQVEYEQVRANLEKWETHAEE